MSAKELILAYWQSWQQPSDLDEMVSYLADDVRFHGGAGELHGPEELRAMIEEYPEPWVDVELVDSHFWKRGGVIVYEGTGGETGVRNRVAELLRVADDKISSITATFARLGPDGSRATAHAVDAPTRPDGIVDFHPDPTLYPFESRWFESSVGAVHYVDEGVGPPLLLLHGNPDWSFLYRKMIPALTDRFRCIAPDYPGFGLSVHPHGYGYTPGEHAQVISELVDHLELDGLVVMGQDWGGPIGMDVASRAPDRIRGLVMGNTWFWPDDQRVTKTFSKSMGSGPLQWLIKERNIFVTRLMKQSLRVKLSAREFAHYTDVVPTPESREGIAVFPRQILDAHPWLGELEQRVADTLREKQVLLVFGRKDPALASDATIERWKQEFPDATYVDLPAAGHYIQEDAPDEIVEAIRATFDRQS